MQKDCTENLCQKIKLRCTSLKKKCDVAWVDMGDTQILELSKSVDHFDSEISEILKGLSNFDLICGDPALIMLYEICKMWDEVIDGSPHK